MIYVDIDLPRAALLDDETPVVSDALGAIHFRSDGLELEAGVPVGWRDTTGRKVARPASPNQGNARLAEVAGRSVLALQDGVNCGFALEDVALTQPKFSMAVLFASPKARAGTLLTLNPKEGRGYLFLSENDGAVSMKFQDKQDEISATGLVQDHLTLVCATVSGDDIRLAVNGGSPKSHAAGAEITPGNYDLFIGCRSDRPGITKTLGEARIASVWLWPDRDVFADDTYQNLIAQMTAEARP